MLSLPAAFPVLSPVFYEAFQNFFRSLQKSFGRLRSKKCIVV